MKNKRKVLEYLHIPRSTFYYESILDEKDNLLKKEIEIVLSNNPSYGHKRIAIELRINHKRIKRVMKSLVLNHIEREKSLGNTAKQRKMRHHTIF